MTTPNVEMAATLGGMETYVNSAGKPVTAAIVEAEYRKQLIVAGRPLEGDEYDQGLEDWCGTYRKLTKADKRSINAATTVTVIGVAITVAIAFIALVAGGGLLAFIIVAIIGSIISAGIGGLVVIFT